MENRMEDEKIIQLIWDREEQGLKELQDCVSDGRTVEEQIELKNCRQVLRNS